MARYIKRQNLNSHKKVSPKALKVKRYKSNVKERDIKMYTTAKDRSKKVRESLGKAKRRTGKIINVSRRVDISNE